MVDNAARDANCPSCCIFSVALGLCGVGFLLPEIESGSNCEGICQLEIVTQYADTHLENFGICFARD